MRILPDCHKMGPKTLVFLTQNEIFTLISPKTSVFVCFSPKLITGLYAIICALIVVVSLVWAFLLL